DEGVQQGAGGRLGDELEALAVRAPADGLDRELADQRGIPRGDLQRGGGAELERVGQAPRGEGGAGRELEVDGEAEVVTDDAREDMSDGPCSVGVGVGPQ